jgi:amino acid transporter
MLTSVPRGSCHAGHLNCSKNWLCLEPSYESNRRPSPYHKHGWSYSLLSVRVRGRGGTAVFLDRVFGTSVAGPLNLLLWLSYFVMLALYAVAFGAYLAAAARPFFGSAGFTLIAVAAVVSKSSAINATLYGAAKFTYLMGRDGELPERFNRPVWNRPAGGLLATMAGTLLIVRTQDQSSVLACQGMYPMETRL